MNKRLIFCGDLHGCIEEFEELLKTLQYNSEQDRLILLGDLTDRGPASAECVKKARELNLEAVCGNHDYKLLQAFKYDKTKKYYYAKYLSQDDVEYLKNLPFYIKLPDVWAVHAGVKPNLPLEDQTKDDLLYLRYTDENRKFISLRQIHKGLANNAIFWTKFGPFQSNVVYGHNVYMNEPNIEKFDNGTACYGIDTGCCFGGTLTALIWDSKEIIQVKAKKEYYKLGFKD